jgi:hypothetical protein
MRSVPAVAWSWKSKPCDWPMPWIAGGISAKICASRTLDSMPIARFEIAWDVLSLPGRSSQSLNAMNAMPAFWPTPMKLNPDMVNSDETFAFSVSR